MTKEHTLICPDIDLPRDRTHELVGELVQSWREGTNAGGGEIAAVAALLTDPFLLPLSYKFFDGSPLNNFLIDFHRFLLEMPSPLPPFVERVRTDQGWEEIPLHIIGFSSATGAIYSALSAATVAGGEVITASLNYVGIPNAIMMAGATPRFVDIDPSTWCMSIESCARAISRNTRAIVLTHVNRLVDVEPFYDLFKRKGLEIPLIQDASLAIGSTHQGLRPGLINVGRGGMTVMSLTVSKIISGLAGAVAVANDPEFLWHAAEIAHQGIPFYDPAMITTFGTNFKMNALNAVIAHEQFKRRETIFERRRMLRAAYERHLQPLVASGRIALQNLGDEAIVTHFGVVLPTERDAVTKILMEWHQIQSGIWHVHHRQKIFRILLAPRIPRLSKTERIGQRLLFLPFHTRISEEDVAVICQALSSAVDEARALETQWKWKPRQPKKKRVKGKGPAQQRKRTGPSVPRSKRKKRRA